MVVNNIINAAAISSRSTYGTPSSSLQYNIPGSQSFKSLRTNPRTVADITRSVEQLMIILKHAEGLARGKISKTLYIYTRNSGNQSSAISRCNLCIYKQSESFLKKRAYS